MRIASLTLVLVVVSGCSLIRINGSGLTLDSTEATSEAEAPKAEGAQAAQPSASASSSPPAVSIKQGRLIQMEENIGEAEKLLDLCCGDANLYQDLHSTYPSTAFAKAYRAAKNSDSTVTSSFLDKDAESTALTPRHQAAQKRLKELHSKMLLKLVLPADKYEGKDGKAVRDVYRQYADQKYKKPVLSVVLLRGDWNRESGVQTIGDRLVSYDQGVICAYVAMKKDATLAEVWLLCPRKDWLDGGKIKFDVSTPVQTADIKIDSIGKDGR